MVTVTFKTTLEYYWFCNIYIKILSKHIVFMTRAINKCLENTFNNYLDYYFLQITLIYITD